MGVSGLWDILRPAGKTRSLTELSVTEGFEANPDGVRGFRIGIDASIWFFHAEYGKEGENPVLRTLFFRCATLMHSPFLPLFVFDGPKRPHIKRGKKINRTSHKLIPGMKTIVESFGFEWLMAPGEAEAELAYLNHLGVIDGILSDDVDNFLFGATTVIRNPSNNLSGNRGNPVLNAAGKDDKNHTRVYRLSDITAHPDIRLTRGGMILVGLMSGGDYQQGGLARCGTVTSHGLAKCGFGDTLFQAANSLTREDLQSFLGRWRDGVRHELRTNSQGHIGKKQPALAKSIPETFPDIDILLSYTNPVTSESMRRAKNNFQLSWSKEPDLGKLAATCEFYFEWGYKKAIIKRFRSVIWHSAVLRILRRAVLDLDAKRTPVTPQRTQPSSSKPVGTPSKMIAKHFSSSTLGGLKGYITDCEDDEDERLIVKIHSSRSHVSTDGILEYRLEIAPAQLVRIAESGIKGIRQPEGPDEWADDEEESSKKLPPDPVSHMRVWMPACMVDLVEPRLVEDFGEVQRRKQEKVSNKGRVKTGRKSKAVAGAPIADDHHTTTKLMGEGTPKGKPKIRTPVVTVDVAHDWDSHTFEEAQAGRVPRFVRDLTKGATRPQGIVEGTRSNMKTFFTSTKPSNTIKAKSNTKIAPPKPPFRKRGSSISSSNDHSVPQRNTMSPSRPSLTRTGESFARGGTALSRALKHNSSLSGYIEISEFEMKDCPSRTKKLAVQSRSPLCDGNHPFENDPFDNAASSTASGQSRKKVAHSSSESDSVEPHLKKSPRRASEHSSPRLTRVRTFPREATDGGTDCVNRPSSPSPLVPFICSTKHATTKRTSKTPVCPMRLIDISSDSDDGNQPMIALPPLELARARAKANLPSGYLAQRSLEDYTNYTQPAGKQSGLKSVSPHDIIDLT